MSGFITKREILIHAVTVVRSFGWVVFWDCLLASAGTTFLSVLVKNERL